MNFVSLPQDTWAVIWSPISKSKKPWLHLAQAIGIDVQETGEYQSRGAGLLRPNAPAEVLILQRGSGWDTFFPHVVKMRHTYYDRKQSQDYEIVYCLVSGEKARTWGAEEWQKNLDFDSAELRAFGQTLQWEKPKRERKTGIDAA